LNEPPKGIPVWETARKHRMKLSLYSPFFQ